MSIWNGSIAPWVQKSYTSKFIPLRDMTPDLWRWLDYENLRETARNKLALAAKKGVTGFYRVDVSSVEKAGPAKKMYLLAGDEEEEPPFENTEDVDDLIEEAAVFDDYINDLIVLLDDLGWPWESIIAIIIIVKEARSQGQSFSISTSPADYDLNDPLIEAARVKMGPKDAQRLVELTELAKSGTLDNLEDIDAALMVALYLYDKYDYQLLRDIVEALEQALSDFEE